MMNYYKCEGCDCWCKSATSGFIDTELCHIDGEYDDAQWQPITKEEFLKELR